MMKNLRLIFSLIFCLVFIFNIFSKSNAEQKTAFKNEYPQFFKFRGEMNKHTHKTYETWSNELISTSGVIRKLLLEELKTNPAVPEWISRFNRQYPDKLLLLHLNGEARQVNDFPDVCERYFPGHWVYEAGGMLLEDCSATQTELKVQNIELFKEKGYIIRNRVPVEWVPTYILLVKLDDNGDRLWYDSEIVHLKSIDKSTNKLIVERGKTNTKSLTFEAGKTYAAPIAGDIWGGDVMLYYNLSSECPQDKTGKTASDIFLEEISEWFSPTGILKDMDGIAFDVNYFNVEKHTRWDVNNDGIADGGVINNQNIWRDGDWEFLKKLRQKMGEDFIITCDGQHSENQQGVGVLNGIESEGLVQHNDSWRGFSRTINTHQYWHKFNNLNNLFHYIVLKFKDKNDEVNQDRLKRFSVATACCIGAYTTHPDNFDFLPSWLNSKSLGTIKSDIIRVAKNKPNVLVDNLNALKDNLSSDNCKFDFTKDGIIISAIDINQKNITFQLKDIELPGGDLTFFIEAKSIDPLNGFLTSDLVPRTFYASMSNLPDYGEKRANDFYSNLYGMIGCKDFSDCSYYFRRPNVEKGKQTLSFKVDGNGRFLIRSIKAYNYPDILIREFEKGIVCVNPAMDEYVVNINEFIPQIKKTRNITINSVDAIFIKK